MKLKNNKHIQSLTDIFWKRHNNATETKNIEVLNALEKEKTYLNIPDRESSNDK